MALEHELGVFRSHLDELLGDGDVNEGRWAVVKGDVVAGPFEDFEAALAFGYGTYGLGGFMAKKVERVETIHRYSDHWLPK